MWKTQTLIEALKRHMFELLVTAFLHAPVLSFLLPGRHHTEAFMGLLAEYS